MTLTLARELLDNADVMEALAAAVAFVQALPEDEVTDEVISRLAEALDEVFPASAMIPPPAGTIVEALDRPAFALLIRLGVALSKRTRRPDRDSDPKTVELVERFRERLVEGKDQ